MSEMKTRDSIQLSYGRYIDWKTQNPVLAPGEIACVFDSGSLYPVAIRFGNGLKPFNDLPSIPLVDTKDKELSEDTQLVCTPAEMDELRAALSSQIKTLEDTIKDIEKGDESLLAELDEDRSPDNKLQALSSVLREIEFAISTRFGRLLSSSASEDGVPFAAAEDLSGERLYYKGTVATARKGDTAYVEGDKREWLYDGETWEPRIMTIPANQQAALQSGITAELVEQLRPIPGKITPLEVATEKAQGDASSALSQVNEIRGEMAHLIQECYVNTITITRGKEGKGYTTKMPIEILDPLSNGSQPVRGFVVSIDDSEEKEGLGALKSDDTECVFLEFTKQQITEHEYQIKPVDEYADLVTESAYGTVTSVKVSQDLWESHDYLKKLIDFHFDDVVHKGSVDGVIKGIRDGKLTPLYSSDAVIYVDGDRTEQGTGIEVDPYRSIDFAIDSVKPGFSGATIVLNAIKSDSGYPIVNKTLQDDISFVGYAVGENTTTAVSNFILRKGEVDKVSVGFRDLRITSGMTLEKLDTVFMDNVTFDVNTTITLEYGGQLHLSHCTVKGPLTINGSNAKVYLDCCTFSDNSSLNTKGDVTVVVEGCTHISPFIGVGGSYIHFSGSLLSEGGTDVAGDFRGAKLVALYSGVALKKSSDKYELATIDATGAESVSLGTFLFDRAAADAHNYIDSTKRPQIDGLDSKQIYVSSKDIDEDTAGYSTDGDNTLAGHLRAISKKLFAITGAATVPDPDDMGAAVTSVKLMPGTVLGTVSLEYYLSTGYIRDHRNVQVFGLKSAAYRDESDFATASGLEAAKEQISELDKTVNNQKGTITDLTARIGQAETTLSPLPKKIEDVTSVADEAKQAAETNKATIQGIDGRVSTLESKLVEDVAKEAELQTLKGRVDLMEPELPKKQLIANKSTTLGDNSSEHEKYPTVGAVVSAINGLENKYEKLENKVTDLGENSQDHSNYPTVGAVIKGLNTRIPTSRLPEDDTSKIVTEQSFRTLSNQRTLIPNQTASSNEDDIFASIEIVKDKATTYYDITASSSINSVSSAQLLKGDTVSYFAYSLADGTTIKYAHNGLAELHEDVIPSPAEGDYYLNIQQYKSKVETVDAQSEVQDIAEVLYKYHNTTWQSQLISGKEITSIAKSQGKAQWTGTAWAIISSPAQAFSREQMTAINSGITSAIVDRLKGTGAGDSVTDLEKSVYKEITSKLNKDCVPTDPNGKTLLLAPKSASGSAPYQFLTKGIAEDELKIESDDSDQKIPTVKASRSIAKDAAEKTADEKIGELKQTLQSSYQPKVSSEHSGKVLLGTSVAGVLESRVLSTTGTDISSATESNDEGKRLPSNNAVRLYVESVKQALAQEDSTLQGRITSLETADIGITGRIDTLEENVSKSVKTADIWAGGTKPAGKLEGMLLQFDSEGHIVNSGKSSSAITGTAYVSTAAVAAVTDGVTYLIDPSDEVQAGQTPQVTGTPNVFLLGTAGKRYISNISFKPYDLSKVSTPDVWKFGAYLSIVQNSDSSHLTSHTATDTVVIADSTVPVSLGKTTTVVSNNLLFRGSTVYLYAPDYHGEPTRYTFTSADSMFEFIDSTVSIHLDDNQTLFGSQKGKEKRSPIFTRCIVHLHGKMKFQEETRFTDCIVYIHNSSTGAPIDFSQVNKAQVVGTMFISESSEPVVLANGEKVTTFYRGSTSTSALTTNVLSTEVADLTADMLKHFQAHTSKRLSISCVGATITIKELTSLENLDSSAWEKGHLDGHESQTFTIDGVVNATTAKNLTGGYISLAGTGIDTAEGTKLSEALTSTGVARKLTMSDTMVTDGGSSLSLEQYLKGTKGVANATNAVTASECTGNAGSATKWKTPRNFTISDNGGSHTGTAQPVDGQSVVDLKLPATIKAEIEGNASTATAVKNAGTGGGTMTFANYTIQSTDWE